MKTKCRVGGVALPEWLALALAVWVWIAAPAAAAPVSPPTAAEQPVSAEDLDRLARTLDDPAARATLLDQIRTMAAVQRAQTEATEAAAPGVVAQILGNVTSGVKSLSAQVARAADALRELPDIRAWVMAEVSDPDRLNHWLRVASKIVAVMFAATLAGFLAARMLAGIRRSLEVRGQSWATRWGLALLRIALDLIPIGAFVLVGYLMLPLLQTSRLTSLAAIELINANVAVRAIMVVAGMILSPRSSAIRPVTLGDETAAYLHLWAGRLTGIGIYGYVTVEALSLLGVPDALRDLLIRLLGLGIMTMLIILILQNRSHVAAWLKGDTATDGFRAEFSAHLHRLAEFWHVLLILYVVAIYLVWALEIRNGISFVVRGSALTLVTVLVARALSIGLGRLVTKGFAIGDDLRSQLPGLEARANHYLPVLHTVLRVALYVIALFVVSQIWGVQSFGWLLSDVGRRISSSAVAIAVVIGVSILIWELLSSLIERYLSETDVNGVPLPRSARTRTLLPLMRNAVMILLILFVILTVMSQLGIDIAPLLAGAGVVGLAVGFGAQTLVKDVITGLFILFEDTISVGDVVEVDGRTGTVETLTVRTLRLRDTSGAVHTVPFSAVGAVRNLTKVFSYHVIKIGVSYTTDLEKAFAAMRAVDEDLRSTAPYAEMILEPIDIGGVDAFGESAIVIQARIKTVAAKQWAVGREFNLRLKLKFDELGIDLPFAQRTVQIVQSIDAASPIAGPPRTLPSPAPVPGGR